MNISNTLLEEVLVVSIQQARIASTTTIHQEEMLETKMVQYEYV